MLMYEYRFVAATIVLVLVAQVLVGLYHIRQKFKRELAAPVVIVVLGRPSVAKTELVRSLQGRISNQQRPFMNCAVSELLSRAPRTLFPDTASVKTESDPEFDVWSVETEGENSVIQFTRIGERIIHALHCSWMQLVAHGCNLIIDYDTVSTWAFDDLMHVLKRYLGRHAHDRTIFVDYEVNQSKIPMRSTPAYPEAVLAAARVNMAEIQQRLKVLQAIRISVMEGEEKDTVDTVFRKLNRTGLV